MTCYEACIYISLNVSVHTRHQLCRSCQFSFFHVFHLKKGSFYIFKITPEVTASLTPPLPFRDGPNCVGSGARNVSIRPRTHTHTHTHTHTRNRSTAHGPARLSTGYPVTRRCLFVTRSANRDNTVIRSQFANNLIERPTTALVVNRKIRFPRLRSPRSPFFSHPVSRFPVSFYYSRLHYLLSFAARPHPPSTPPLTHTPASDGALLTSDHSPTFQVPLH